MLWNIAKFQITTRLARAGQCPDHGAEAAAIDEDHFAEVKHNCAAVSKQPSNVGAQGFYFAPGH